MKEIFFSKDKDTFIFDFYFKHNAHILMSMLGGMMVLVFTMFYLLKPWFKINDDSYFLIVFFVASLITLRLYGKFKWLSVKRRLIITPQEIILYHAKTLQKKILTNEVQEIQLSGTNVFIFPINSIIITSKDENISIPGFKKGEDMDNTYSKLRQIILQKSQV
jgi:hypothetical protein